MKKLETMTAEQLQSAPYSPVPFLVDELLPEGLHILAGAPKIGKSWLALWLCLCVSQGQALWNFATTQGEVLYLSLEDSFQRIQTRLFDVTEDAPPTLHFAIMADTLKRGLEQQIEQFLTEHPATKLVVIDTLQRVRSAGSDSNLYANDYQDIGLLKRLADSKTCTGASRISTLRIENLLSELLQKESEISAPAKALLEKIDPVGSEGWTPNSFSHQIRKSVDTLRQNGILVSFRKSNGERLVCLKRVDGADLPTVEKIAPIDPAGVPSACTAP